MKQKGTYAVCLLILACLIGSAFYAPGLVMRWNDYQLLQDYQFQKRDGIDYEAINTNYIMDRKERLNTFAKAVGEGKQFYIASTGKTPAYSEEILANIWEQDMVYLLMEADILWKSEGIYDSRSITACDHYVIYDSDGVSFLCWYLELTTEEEIVRMLVDTQDHTIYYMECYHQGVFQMFSDHYTKDVMDWSWALNGLMNIKWLYGGVSEQEIAVRFDAQKGKSAKISDKKYNEVKTDATFMEERHELTSSISYEDGSLRLQACVLNSVDELYGFGIGIKELWDLLPTERKGECLVSFG